MADQPDDQVMDSKAAGGSSGASTYYPLEGKPTAGQVYRSGHQYVHGDYLTCKLCTPCHPCIPFCIKCKTCSCIPQCQPLCDFLLKCKTCSCIPQCEAFCLQCRSCSCIPGCDLSCKALMSCSCHPGCEKLCAPCQKCRTCDCIPGCNMSCLACQTCECHPSCAGKCPDCDMSCESCMKCGCHPACSPCLAFCQCDLGPDCELKAVGCELCPGPLQSICGNWHVSSSRFPMKLPAIIYPCCCGPSCPMIPCPGAKDETFENNDFKNPGTLGPVTATIPCARLFCPNIADKIQGMIPATFRNMPGFKSGKNNSDMPADSSADAPAGADEVAAPEDVNMEE